MLDQESFCMLVCEPVNSSWTHGLIMMTFYKMIPMGPGCDRYFGSDQARLEQKISNIFKILLMGH